MFATSLPLLPPPATSLLPPFHNRSGPESSNQIEGQHSLQAQQQRRARGHPHAMHPRSQLAMLAYDERIISQRKLAIQMYGYSWLKPAGCTKTMLGRREEEIEREEVERQLRDVEMQERNQAEMEEAQRQAQLEEQRAREARGEDVGVEGERDLDDEVPDMDATGEFEDEDSEESEEDDDGDEINLDDDVPEADSGWVYDTTRDPETDSESEQQRPPRPQTSAQARPNMSGRLGPPSLPGQGLASSEADHDEYEDRQEHDLDDDLPNMDADDQDLDNDIPDADEDDGGWEHTDTELEESDMDISIMPPGVVAHHVSMPPPSSTVSQASNRQLSRQSMTSQQNEMSSGMRRTSGNIPLPMAPPARPTAAARGLAQSQQLPPNLTPDQLGSDFSVSALISTGNTEASPIGGAQGQRAWLDPASARRNLFGAGRNAVARSSTTVRSVSGQPPTRSLAGSNSSQASTETERAGMQAPRQVSSGGLFTPSPVQNNPQRGQRGLTSNEDPQSRTRSGRVISRAGGGRGD